MVFSYGREKKRAQHNRTEQRSGSLLGAGRSSFGDVRERTSVRSLARYDTNRSSEHNNECVLRERRTVCEKGTRSHNGAPECVVNVAKKHGGRWLVARWGPLEPLNTTVFSDSERQRNEDSFTRSQSVSGDGRMSYKESSALFTCPTCNGRFASGYERRDSR